MAAEPLWKPRPAKVDDLAGARLAAVAEFRELNPDVHEARIHVTYTGPWIGVYAGPINFSALTLHGEPTPVPTGSANARAMRYHEAERARRRAEVDAALALPSPSVPATVLPEGDERIPRGVKTWLNLAKKHGWRARVTYAVGPRLGAGGKILDEACYTICIAMQNDRGWRLVMEYRWNGPQQKWELEDVLDGQNAAILPTSIAKERMAA